MSTVKPLIDEIRHFDPCDEAIRWLSQRTLEEAWAECPRGDWLLWLAERAGVDRRQVVLTACDCAEPALRHVPERFAELVRARIPAASVRAALEAL